MQVMHIIAIISIIADCFLAGWLESVGSRVAYELDYKKPILYVVPIQSILGKLPLVPVAIPVLSRTTCTTPFRALPATGGRAKAMDDGCGSSTHGHWDGPVTCNKSHWIANSQGLGLGGPGTCELAGPGSRRGERFHVNTPHRHVWAMLPSALAVL